MVPGNQTNGTGVMGTVLELGKEPATLRELNKGQPRQKARGKGERGWEKKKDSSHTEVKKCDNLP